MKVSIVIPCYRQAHFLPFAINCALQQTHHSVEVVVVNDGSDDDTELISQSYGERIRYVYKRNGGLSSARNFGMAVSTGKYLLFLDADDLLDPFAVESLLQASEQRDDVIASMGSRRFVSDPVIGTAPDRLPSEMEYPLKHLIHRNLGPVHSFLCPAELARRANGFEESLQSCEDYDFWTRLLIEGARLSPVNFVGAFYRDTPGSMSKNYFRLLSARTEVLLRTHAAIVRLPEMVKLYGRELIEAERRVLKRIISHDVYDWRRQALYMAIEELERLGFRLDEPPLFRWARRISGRASDTIACKWRRLFDAQAVSKLRSDYW